MTGKSLPKEAETVIIDAKTKALLDRYTLSDIPSHLLRRAHFLTENNFTAEFGKYDLTPRQKALLVTIYQNPGANQNVLAEKIALDRNTFSEMLKRMTTAGYLHRARAKSDGRAFETHLTQKAVDLLQKVLPTDLQLENDLLKPLAPEMRSQFINSLKIIIGLDAG
jgi:DNA-binding MarR family transcriptional regulator